MSFPPDSDRVKPSAVPGALGRSVLVSLPLAALLALASFPVTAGVEKASRFYEDAAARVQRQDLEGAIIQLKNALQEDPQLLAAQELLGRVYLANSQPDAAREAFDKALRLGISPEVVALPLAQTLLKQGRPQEMLDRFPVSAVPTSSRSDLLVLRGQAHRATGDFAAAKQAYDDALAIAPRAPEALLALGELHASQQQFDAANRAVDTVIADNPGNPKGWYVKGTVLHQSGNATAALDAYAKALSIAPEYVDARVARVALMLERKQDVELRPDIDYMRDKHAGDPRCNYLRSIYLARNGDAEGSRAALMAAARSLAPLSIEVMKRRLPEYLMLAGMVFHGLNEPQRAQSYFEAFLAVAPGHVGARKTLGSILIARRDFVSAQKVLEGARQRAPKDPQVLALLGDAYIGRNRPQAASEVLKEAMELTNAAPGVQSSLGFSLLQGGHADEGLRHLQAGFDRDPSRTGAAMALVMHYLNRKDTRRALEVANKAIARNPESPDLLNVAGLAKAAAGDLKGARTNYDKALRLRSGFRAASLNLARLDLEEGRFDAARKRLADLLQADPKSVPAVHEMARLESRSGRRKEAIGWLEKAYSMDPGYRPAAVELIDARLRAHDSAGALEVARALESRAPEDLDVLAIVARTQTATGDSKAATIVLAKMARLANFNPVRQTEIAALQLAAGNLSGATHSLEKALSDDAGYAPAIALQADVDLAKGDLDTAERRGQGLLASNPALFEGYRILGDVAYRRGRVDEAEKRYREALARNSSTTLALRVTGALLQSRAPERGLQFLESWHNQHPADVVAQRSLAEAYMRLGKIAQARQRFETLTSRLPDDATILNNLANCMNIMGDTAKAVATAEKALALSPEDPAIRDTLGWLLVKSGSIDMGLRHLRDARLRDPRNPEIRYHLAAALAKAGRDAEAREELREALGARLDFPEAADARALGKKLSLL